MGDAYIDQLVLLDLSSSIDNLDHIRPYLNKMSKIYIFRRMS